MRFLLDTNVISEPGKPKPDSRVLAWLEANDEDRMYLSAVTLAELQRGVERLPEGSRRRRMEEWLWEDVVERFERRILAVDAPVARAWGNIVTRMEKAGRPMNSMDGFIAATAEFHGLTLVTRNSGDFTQALPKVLNPWE